MRVTSKGQVTIPKPIRDRVGIRPGTEVEFAVDDGRVVLTKRPSGQGERERRLRELEEYLDEVEGTLDLGMSTDEFMQLLRGE
jgi:AbrB family looped-hinge helix DNA binding protein